MLPCAKSSNAAGKSRSRKSFRPNLEKKLLTYSAAASAVCMATLAPAQAEIIYTPVDIVTKVGVFGTLDIDGDGIADFQYFRDYSARCGRDCTQTFYYFNSFFLTGLQTNNGAVQGTRTPIMARLAAKDRVGGGDTFVQDGVIFVAGPNTQWTGPARGYVGLKFKIGGEVHYGWLRLTVTLPNPNTVTIAGYAYETVPNKPIVINQRPAGSAQEFLAPGSLGRLAAGAQAHR